MTDIDDDMLFSEDEEGEDITHDNSVYPWRLLIVDDEQDIHTVTKIALNNFEFENRPIEFLSAYSGAEAREILSKEMDIALVFLDVVMESKHAGLDVAKWIREELGNHEVRIVLRTGQPGEAPERAIITDYDINDYKEKSELTSQKLYTVMCASCRSYQDIVALNKNRACLRMIIESSADIFRMHSFEKFAEGTLGQLSSLLNLQSGSAYILKQGLAAHKEQDKWIVLAGTEHYAQKVGTSIEADLKINLDTIFSEGKSINVIDDNRLFACVNIGGEQKAVMILEGYISMDNIDISLVELFLRNISIAYENIVLLKITRME